MNITRAEARTFTFAAVIGSAFTWDIAFNLGVYGTIFFEKIFLVWSASLAVLLVSLVLPDERAPVNWRGRIVLFLPTAWFMLAFLQNPEASLSRVDFAVLVIGVVIYALSLPYSLYVIGRITNPEFFGIRSRRLGVALVLIILLIASISYAIGRNNHLFLSCYDFRVSGNDVPTDCAETSPIDPLFQ